MRAPLAAYAAAMAAPMPAAPPVTRAALPSSRKSKSTLPSDISRLRSGLLLTGDAFVRDITGLEVLVGQIGQAGQELLTFGHHMLDRDVDVFFGDRRHDVDRLGVHRFALGELVGHRETGGQLDG